MFLSNYNDYSFDKISKLVFTSFTSFSLIHIQKMEPVTEFGFIRT